MRAQALRLLQRLPGALAQDASASLGALRGLSSNTLLNGSSLLQGFNGKNQENSGAINSAQMRLPSPSFASQLHSLSSNADDSKVSKAASATLTAGDGLQQSSGEPSGERLLMEQLLIAHKEKENLHKEKEQLQQQWADKYISLQQEKEVEKDNWHKKELLAVEKTSNLRLESQRILQLQQRVNVRGAMELAAERARTERTISCGVGGILQDVASRDEDLWQCMKEVAGRHNERAGAVRESLRLVYGILSRRVHESRGSVVLNLADEAFSHPELIAMACFLQRYSVMFKVLDKYSDDVTDSYCCSQHY